ncbi:HDIG domain-containing protein [Desulfosarcina widdelii]|uniref:HDIG domain-containing protein n=1 Tax=Desulfosarcina widdelii TaxID=947919 RepID=A0A5K7ZHH3_9BACT|nr:HD domain-containing protein [Desulfosarcina widdelii]BBO79281.1 HDIG domain-containing protein [Desulfosarcina widdelii]
MQAMPDFSRFDLKFLPETTDAVYLVGGSVRDLLAGRRPADFDLAVAGDIRRIAGQIAAKTGGTVVDLGNKGFEVLRVASPETMIDLSPLDGPGIEVDLQRRDFTVNALAWDVRSRQLVDCTGGLADMQRRTIRMVSSTALEKDPARLVRAYRLAAVLGFSIDSETRTAIASHHHLIGSVAAERVWAELEKLLACDRSAPHIRDMAESGLLISIFPELAPAVGCGQNRYHAFDVFEHSLQAYAHMERLIIEFDSRYPELSDLAEKQHLVDHAPILKYACLLHDVGKPATRRVDAAGQVHFYGHAAKSADIAAGASERLHLSRKQRQTADAIIRHHIRPLFLYLASENDNLGRRGMIRFFNRCGDMTLPIVVHTMADIMAKRPVIDGRDEGFIHFCSELLNAYRDFCSRRAALPPLIDGHDLMEIFGLAPSPLIGRIIKQVHERRLSGELATRNRALAWVRAYLDRRAEDR